MTFYDWLKEQKDDGNIFAQPMDPQIALYLLQDHLLGEDWYVNYSCSVEQANTEIVGAILDKYCKKPKATWGTDYDFRTDENYKAPVCGICGEPIIKDSEGNYSCVSCLKDAELTKDMKKWFAEREGKTTKTSRCVMCGEKTLEGTYHKNPITLDWEFGYGECKNCGAKIMV